MVDEIETPEKIFFKYAFSCSDELMNLGLIENDIHERLIKYHDKGTVPERSFLESVYKNAIIRIEKLAQSLGRDKWDVFVIRKYFLEEHNKIIDRQEGNYKIISPSHRELCKVHIGIVKRKYLRNSKLLTYDVLYGGRINTVVGKYLPNVDVGDRISIHWNFAIEKVE